MNWVEADSRPRIPDGIPKQAALTRVCRLYPAAFQLADRQEEAYAKAKAAVEEHLDAAARRGTTGGWQSLAVHRRNLDNTDSGWWGHATRNVTALKRAARIDVSLTDALAYEIDACAQARVMSRTAWLTVAAEASGGCRTRNG
ncbi:type II toxin-antitoxin system HicB family antitoxin [Paraburkholderia sp. PREW-6R]|uniref:type II toxin-antitoxin system HicB family antitoxin n=1 Tax=Paraburkholderia sp. PREW-6R TaxID=3141544 RepID=UPI0031F4930D